MRTISYEKNMCLKVYIINENKKLDGLEKFNTSLIGFSESDLLEFLEGTGLKYSIIESTIWIDSSAWASLGNDVKTLISSNKEPIKHVILNSCDYKDIDLENQNDDEIISKYLDLYDFMDSFYCGSEKHVAKHIKINEEEPLFYIMDGEKEETVNFAREYLSEYQKAVRSFYEGVDFLIEISDDEPS